jgi:hypothetical protein
MYSLKAIQAGQVKLQISNYFTTESKMTGCSVILRKISFKMGYVISGPPLNWCLVVEKIFNSLMEEAKFIWFSIYIWALFFDSHPLLLLSKT